VQAIGDGQSAQTQAFGTPSHQAAVPAAKGNDRPIDLPAQPPQAAPTPNDLSALAASASRTASQGNHVDGRHARVSNRISSMDGPGGDDDGLSMTVMPHAAHMSIESSEGDLALHLRVRHGSADVTVGGSMAPLFESRAPEARAALASEGLSLGRFDLGQQGGGQQGQPAPERPERASEPSTPYRHQATTAESTPTDGRIHVTA
jgi:hypothetical protein